MRKVAILQSNYIPWKGYFDIINSADIFIFYDQAQYTKNDWRNRNLIKTPRGTQWLTIPVRQTGLKTLRICDTVVANSLWRKKHWQSLITYYAKSPHFKLFKQCFYELYREDDEENLSRINVKFIQAINGLLGINTEMAYSSSYQLVEGKTERLVQLCKDNQATHYISGAAAKNYLNLALFDQAGIEVIWMDYSQYPDYAQLFPPFMHQVSIVDLLFNHGLDAKNYMLSFS